MALSTTQYGYIIDPMVPFTDDKGKTIKDGFVRVFVAGSSTPVITYRNFDGAANQDLIELDNSGRTKTSVIGSKGLTYKVCVYDAFHSQESPILTIDKVSVIGANITAGAGSTVVTGLDGLTTKPDGFVDASVVGTDGYVALDHTLVTDDLDTDAKVTAVEEDRYVPLLNEDVNDPDSKMTLGRLWQWILGKIKSLPTTITAFRTGDVIPVDGPSGTAKMSKDDLLQETAENALIKTHSQFYASNNGNIYYEETRTSNGSVYIKSTSGNWAVREGGVAVTYNSNSDLAASLGVTLVTSPAGVTGCIEVQNLKVIVLKDDNTLVLKDRSLLSGKDSVVFGVINGCIVSFDGTKFGQAVFGKLSGIETDVKANHTDSWHRNTTQLYASNNGNIYIEETRTNGGSLYIKSTTDSWAVRGSSPTPSYTNATFAASVGSSLVTSHAGVTNCIEIQSGKSLVLNSSNEPKIKTRETVLTSDCLVVSCLNGVAVAFDTRVFGGAISYSLKRLNDSVTQDETNFLFSKLLQIYPNNSGSWYFETDGTTVYFKSTTNSFAIRAYGSKTYNSMADFATDIGVSVVTTPNGVSNCIALDSTKVLVIDNTLAPKIRTRETVKATDVAVFSNVNGKIVSFNSTMCGQYVFDKLQELSNSIGDGFFFENDDWQTKALDVAGKLNNTTHVDKFIFFTDPHTLPHGDWENLFKIIMTPLRKYNLVLPNDFVLCGGDWLTNSDTQSEAIMKLGFATAWMQQNFNVYYGLVGNHDTNYQGVVSPDDSSSGNLTQDTINNVMFGRNGGKSYYDVADNNTRFYMMDSGIDWLSETMTNYQWEQVEWFALKLIENDDEHSAIAMHILTRNDFGDTDLDVLFTKNIMEIASAYNSRTTITKNGVTYDFTACNGYCEFCIGGHSHKDLIHIYNNIPMVATINASNNYLCFDYVIVDYDENKLKLVRFGLSGSDRETTIYSGNITP